MSSDMSTEPGRIRADIEALLAAVPDVAAPDADIDAVAAGLEAAHEMLVRALDSVEPSERSSATRQDQG